MTYTLFYSPGACSLAAHIALEEAGLPPTLKLVSTRDRSTEQPAYLAINPKGRVPALSIPGEEAVLTELPAILRYVVERHPGPQFGRFADPLLDARANEWLGWLSSWVHAQGFGLIWRPERSNPDSAAHPALIAQGRAIVADAFTSIEAKLDGWAMAGTYSIVDPFLFVLYLWGGFVGLDMRARHPAWAAHTAAMLARPAVLRAVKREGLDQNAWAAR